MLEVRFNERHGDPLYTEVIESVNQKRALLSQFNESIRTTDVDIQNCNLDQILSNNQKVKQLVIDSLMSFFRVSPTQDVNAQVYKEFVVVVTEIESIIERCAKEKEEKFKELVFELGELSNAIKKSLGPWIYSIYKPLDYSKAPGGYSELADCGFPVSKAIRSESDQKAVGISDTLKNICDDSNYSHEVQSKHVRYITDFFSEEYSLGDTLNSSTKASLAAFKELGSILNGFAGQQEINEGQAEKYCEVSFPKEMRDLYYLRSGVVSSFLVGLAERIEEDSSVKLGAESYDLVRILVGDNLRGAFCGEKGGRDAWRFANNMLVLEDEYLKTFGSQIELQQLHSRKDRLGKLRKWVGPSLEKFFDAKRVDFERVTKCNYPSWKGISSWLREPKKISVIGGVLSIGGACAGYLTTACVVDSIFWERLARLQYVYGGGIGPALTILGGVLLGAAIGLSWTSRRFLWRVRSAVHGPIDVARRSRSDIALVRSLLRQAICNIAFFLDKEVNSRFAHSYLYANEKGHTSESPLTEHVVAIMDKMDQCRNYKYLNAMAENDDGVLCLARMAKLCEIGITVNYIFNNLKRDLYVTPFNIHMAENLNKSVAELDDMLRDCDFDGASDTIKQNKRCRAKFAEIKDLINEIRTVYKRATLKDDLDILNDKVKVRLKSYLEGGADHVTYGMVCAAEYKRRDTLYSESRKFIVNALEQLPQLLGRDFPMDASSRNDLSFKLRNLLNTYDSTCRHGLKNAKTSENEASLLDPNNQPIADEIFVLRYKALRYAAVGTAVVGLGVSVTGGIVSIMPTFLFHF